MPPLFYYFGACLLPLLHSFVAKEAGLVLWLSKPVFLCSPMPMFVFSHSVLSDSLQPHRLQPTRLLCPWDSPGKSSGVGCHFLFQGIFPTRGQNPCLLHWQAGFAWFFFFNHQGSPTSSHLPHFFLLLTIPQWNQLFSYLLCAFTLSLSKACDIIWSEKQSSRVDTGGTLPSPFLPNRKPWIIFIIRMHFLL